MGVGEYLLSLWDRTLTRVWSLKPIQVNIIQSKIKSTHFKCRSIIQLRQIQLKFYLKPSNKSKLKFKFNPRRKQGNISKSSFRRRFSGSLLPPPARLLFFHLLSLRDAPSGSPGASGVWGGGCFQRLWLCTRGQSEALYEKSSLNRQHAV